MYDFLIASNVACSICMSDKVNSYIRTHKVEVAPVARPTSQIHLSQLALMGNAVKGNLIYTNHNPLTQLGFA